jgi:hypothetical protein
MQRFGVFCLIGLFLAFGAACGGGKSEEAKPAAETATEAAKAAAGAEGDVAKGVQEFAKAMEELQTSPDGKAYEPVSFTALQAFFPEIGGWEMEKPRGESMTAPVKFSQAEAAYTKGDSRIELKIVDTAMSKLLSMPYQMFLATGYSSQTDNGYEKATKVAGNPGWEKWDGESKHAELGTIVGQRYIVTADGSGTDVKTVQEFLSKIDLARLAALK